MKIIFKIFFLWLVISSGCTTDKKENNSSSEKEEKNDASPKKSKIDLYYSQNKGNDSASISSGTYGNGKLMHGKLLPFKGENFRYFSEASYLSGRAFVNDKVLKILLETYNELDSIYPGKTFYLMESSYKDGGKFFPHRTHQNGLSIDLMTPLLKNGKEYTGLDLIGIPHYWIEFDENGAYSKDKSITIHFNLVAHHILLLDQTARKYGYKVNRVHFQNTLHDEIYDTQYGKELKKKGIILTQGLSKLISEQHDDHFHVDFSQQ